MHHLFVCTMKISETPHTGHPHSTHMHTLVYGVTCLGAFVSGCAFILDYQKKEWQRQVLLLWHASGIGGGRCCAGAGSEFARVRGSTPAVESQSLLYHA